MPTYNVIVPIWSPERGHIVDWKIVARVACDDVDTAIKIAKDKWGIEADVRSVK